MRADSGRWVEVTRSRFEHEREGLDHVRDHLPDAEPYRAWSNFEFIGVDSFVRAMLQNINAGSTTISADIDFVRSRDREVVTSAFTSPCSVLHVMAHSGKVGEPFFSSGDDSTVVPLSQLAGACARRGKGIQAAAVIADGCKTGMGAWQAAVRDCLQGPVTYIGTTAAIGWHESTVFCSTFFGALFRNRGRGSTPSEQASDAARRAIKAFELLTDRPRLYKVVELQPSRSAPQWQGRAVTR